MNYTIKEIKENERTLSEGKDFISLSVSHQF